MIVLAVTTGTDDGVGIWRRGSHAADVVGGGDGCFYVTCDVERPLHRVMCDEI